MGWYYGWRPYVPVAARRARARREMQKLHKKGMSIQPVEIEGRKITRTFWGEAWCDHLENFSDFASRLPRGRTYVRNGSVCHLEIKPGAVKAMVSGSELYNVNVKIKELPKKKWRQVKNCCAGRIGSLLELLQGRLSESVMAVVTDRNKGLFPLPREIGLKCDCPDWAVMCKHVAAVLYGVGARLDERPELLFLLRGVDHEELINAEADVAAATAGKAGKRRRIAADELSDVFGIEMADEKTAGASATARARSTAIPRRRRRKTAASRRAGGSARTTVAGDKTRESRRRSTRTKTKAEKKAFRKRAAPAAREARRIAKKAAPSTQSSRSVTARAVVRLRAKFDMSQSQFARLLGVSAPTIDNWEKTGGRRLNLRRRSLDAWKTVARLTKREAWKRLDGV